MKLSQFTVVTVPFPFSDRSSTKKRPALVLSSGSTFNSVIGHSVLAMITSAKNSPWPLDVEISNIKASGLPVPSRVRMKLFTLDQRLILGTLGTLSSADTKSVKAALQNLFECG